MLLKLTMKWIFRIQEAASRIYDASHKKTNQELANNATKNICC